MKINKKKILCLFVAIFMLVSTFVSCNKEERSQLLSFSQAQSIEEMKKLGLLTYRWEESTQGPPRKYYMITNYGKEQLAGLDAAWEELAQGINIIRNGSKA